MVAMMESTVKLDPSMYDSSSGYDDESTIRYASNLTEEEHNNATILYKFFNELWGIVAVKGDLGAGKDLFGNWLQHTLGRYFPALRLIRDEKPLILFGKYDSLFNEYVINEELKKMQDIAKGIMDENNKRDKLIETARQWATDEGKVLLHNSILYLTEWWRYCNKRYPFNPMNNTMGGIHREIRHMTCLLIGTTQLISDLDKHTCKPFINWQVTCGRSNINWSTFKYRVHPVHYEPRLDILEIMSGKPTLPITIDAAKPCSFLGNGKIYIRNDRYKYDAENEEERIILDVIKAGYDTYESIVDLIYDKGDMTEDEILATLKELKYRRYKKIIDYPDYFHIYNSRSVPNITSKIKVEA